MTNSVKIDDPKFHSTITYRGQSFSNMLLQDINELYGISWHEIQDLIDQAYVVRPDIKELYISIKRSSETEASIEVIVAKSVTENLHWRGPTVVSQTYFYGPNFRRIIK